MEAPAFNEITNLEGLQAFVAKAEQNGTVKAGWRGREIAVGKQTVSEKTIWERFKELQRSTSASKENWEHTGLCEHHLERINQKKEEDAPWYVKVFRFFLPSFFKETVNIQQNLKDINQIARDTPTETADKARADRLILITHRCGDEYKELREALANIKEEMSNDDIIPIASAIVKDVPLTRIPQVLGFLTPLVLSAKNKSIYEELNKEIRKRLTEELAEKMSKEFAPEQAKIWEQLFDNMLNRVLITVPQADLKTILQEAEIKRALNVLDTLQTLHLSPTGIYDRFIDIVKQHASPTPETLTEDIIQRHVTAADQKFAKDYLIDPNNFNKHIGTAGLTEKPKIWNQALAIISRLNSHEETKQIAIQLLMNINPPSFRKIDEEEWENQINSAITATTEATGSDTYLHSAFTQKAITCHSEYQKVDKELLSKTFLFSQYTEEKGKTLFRLGLTHPNTMGASLFLSCIARGIKDGFSHWKPPTASAK